MKKVLSGVAVLVILIIAAVLVYNNQEKSTIKGELTDFAVQDTAAITMIKMKDDAGVVATLERDGSDWIVNGKYKARPDGIQTLLTTMKKLSIKAPVSQQALQSSLKSIISDHVLVEVYEGNSLVKSYYVGGADPNHTGTHMLMNGSSRPYLVHIEGFHGFLTPRYFVNELEWRHRGVFEYDNNDIAKISIEFFKQPERSFSIEKNQSGEGYIVNYGVDFSKTSEAVDNMALSGYLKNYKLVHYESYEETKPEEYTDSVMTSKPEFEIVVTTTDGTSKRVKGFKKPLLGGSDPEGNPTDVDIDRLYLLIDNETFVVGQYAIFDKLTKGINFFKRG